MYVIKKQTSLLAERREPYVSSYRSFSSDNSLRHSSNACGLGRKMLARDKMIRKIFA